MLPPAARHLVDRLITAVMILVRAVAPTQTNPRPPTLAESAAEILFYRLSLLAIRLIDIHHFGIPTPPKPRTAPENPEPALADPSDPSGPSASPGLPRRPGWLLDALPDIAPPIAAEITLLLADPAIADLLERAPSLHRALHPLLRGLGIDAPALQAPLPPGAPPPGAPPPGVPAPLPATTEPQPAGIALNPATPTKTARLNAAPTHAHIVPQSKRMPIRYEAASPSASTYV